MLGFVLSEPEVLRAGGLNLTYDLDEQTCRVTAGCIWNSFPEGECLLNCGHTIQASVRRALVGVVGGNLHPWGMSVYKGEFYPVVNLLGQSLFCPVMPGRAKRL